MANKNISIKKIITIIFIISLLASTTLIGYIIFSGWLSSTEELSKGILEETSNEIYEKVSSFLFIPFHINEWNYNMIERGIIDLANEETRDKFFVNVLSSHGEEVYSFSLGTVNGEYYGARRNEEGKIEIMRNNTSTGGHSWYYSVNEDMTAGELALKAGEFDPRTREWYKIVEKLGEPSFSPIYEHFIMKDLTISFGWPIYNKDGKFQGVLATHTLLSEVGSFLHENIAKYNGYAVIIEKDSGELIANSMGMENYSYLKDGSLVRHTVCDIENESLKNVCKKYMEENSYQFIYKNQKERFLVNAKEVGIEGLNWTILSAIPQDLYYGSIRKRAQYFIVLTGMALIFSLFIYNKITKKLFKPIDHLLEVSAALSSGDLSQRVKMVRKDEIGGISESLNRVADKMAYLINNLEVTVKKRTEELERTNNALEESKTRLEMLLNSTVEGIYGIDLNGVCTFCNESAIKMLGYDSQEEMLGKNMHQLIHHSYRDGTEFPIENCKIIEYIRRGKVYSTDNEVFWKADGTYLDVEFFFHPQIRDGKVIGGVVTFIDITDRKKKEEEIKYLSSHDMLTGLQNKWSFEKNLEIVDTPENLPISIIFADINGLKLTNDIFGHSAGDELIIKSSQILKKHCRNNDIIARIGGDEFIILLPNTNKENAKKVVDRINQAFSDSCVVAIKCSLSIGMDTKVSEDQSLKEIMSNAEDAMYRDKALNRRSVNKEIIQTIIENLHIKHDSERRHSMEVSNLAEMLGKELNLSEEEIFKLKRAAYFHDIGKVALKEGIIDKRDLSAEEKENMRQHSIIGYRILSLFDETMDLAEYVYSHHERWDGKGYPKGLKREKIPLLSRIIYIVESYERLINNKDIPEDKRKEYAINEIKKASGKKFDPNLVEIFIKIINNE